MIDHTSFFHRILKLRNHENTSQQMRYMLLYNAWALQTASKDILVGKIRKSLSIF